eukprot:TRINITY_DN3477_c0_g1_i1.p1 TRINITY_DN3477_c0_g1~~TRINITY_DN3477_c0_g1_i1.p1  ORF type:complete len:243 (+),score=63.92 TRINITY_DN3477_c0_g1_i1:74-730(+)
MLAPCAACGQACGALRHGCGGMCKECGQICRGCSQVCDDCCHEVTSFLCPQTGISRVFVSFAIGISIAVLAVAISGIVAEGDDCTGDAKNWLFSAIAAAVVNAAGAALAHSRFAALMAKERAEKQHHTGKCKAVCHFICYDCGVFVYMVICVGIIAWVVKSGGHHVDCDKAVDALHTIRMLFTAFLAIGPCVACCSLSNEPSRKTKDVEAAPGYGATE